MACLDLADRRAQGRPFRVWRAELATQVTLQEDGLLSLWQEGRESRGYDRPLILRRGDTWSLAEGAPRTLASFYPKQRRWKKRLLEQVERQARERLDEGRVTAGQGLRLAAAPGIPCGKLLSDAGGRAGVLSHVHHSFRRGGRSGFFCESARQVIFFGPSTYPLDKGAWIWSLWSG